MKAKQIKDKLILIWEKDDEIKIGETIKIDLKRVIQEERNRIIKIIDSYTTPAHPNIHSMRWLKLDSETLKEMTDVIKNSNSYENK